MGDMDNQPSNVLRRSDIDQATDLKGEFVPVPEWGGQVYLRVMPGSEADAWKQKAVDARRSGRIDIKGLEADLVARVMVNPETGERLYPTDKDVATFNATKSGRVINRLFLKAQEMNGMGADVEAVHKELEERGKD